MTSYAGTTTIFCGISFLLAALLLHFFIIFLLTSPRSSCCSVVVVIILVELLYSRKSFLTTRKIYFCHHASHSSYYTDIRYRRHEHQMPSIVVCFKRVRDANERTVVYCSFLCSHYL